MPNDAWQPQGRKGCHGNEGPVLFLERLLTIIRVLRITGTYLNLAEHSQRSVVQEIAEEEGGEDERARQTGNEDEEDKVGQGD